jgi:hypothetical protein
VPGKRKRQAPPARSRNTAVEHHRRVGISEQALVTTRRCRVTWMPW